LYIFITNYKNHVVDATTYFSNTGHPDGIPAALLK